MKKHAARLAAAAAAAAAAIENVFTTHDLFSPFISWENRYVKMPTRKEEKTKRGGGDEQSAVW